MTARQQRPESEADAGGGRDAVSRRERILTAAIAAFAARGYAGASTREIAQAAAVTDPLLFYYFKSKADLYLAAVEDQLAMLGNALGAALAGAPTATAALERFVAVYLESFLDLFPGLTVTLRELSGVPEPPAGAIAATHHRVVTQQLESILERGIERREFRPVDVRASALAVIGILQIFIRASARSPGAFTRAQAVAQVLDHYAVSLRAPADR
jgi:TetR/AcrR family transcriptional regulator